MKEFTMRTARPLALFASLSSLLLILSFSSFASAEEAYVHVLHASPDAPPLVSVLSDGKALTEARIGDTGGYLGLSAGTRTLSVIPKGSSKALVTAKLNAVAGHEYLLAVIGSSKRNTLKALLIDETQTFQKAKVSDGLYGKAILLNAFEGAGAVDVYFGKDLLRAKLPYGAYFAQRQNSVDMSGDAVYHFRPMGQPKQEIAGSLFTGAPNATAVFALYGRSDPKQPGSGATFNTTSRLNTLEFLSRLGTNAPESLRFTALVKAVKAAGLKESLGKASLFLLAPNDSAFAARPAGKLDGLLANQAQLSMLLKYHLLQRNPNFEAAFGPGSDEPTQAGKTVRFVFKPDPHTPGFPAPYFGSAPVAYTPIQVANGVIWPLGGVLDPTAK